MAEIDKERNDQGMMVDDSVPVHVEETNPFRKMSGEHQLKGAWVAQNKEMEP